MGREEILLKEYEACQGQNQAQLSRYWTAFSIFISIITAIISGLVYVLLNTNIINTFFIPLIVLSVGMFLIIEFLELSLKRVNYVIQNNIRRMLEIEIELNMWKELSTYIFDKWNKIRKKLKIKTKPCDSQNKEIWTRVWNELSTELSTNYYDSIYKEKNRIETIPYQRNFSYAWMMEGKVIYLFWGIRWLYVLAISSSLFSLLYQKGISWAYAIYVILFVLIIFDICKKEHKS